MSTPDNVAPVENVDRTSVADRAWVHEAVRRVEADGNRLADTHLVRMPLWSFPATVVERMIAVPDAARWPRHGPSNRFSAAASAPRRGQTSGAH